ncbi:MAG TPA: DUF4097 family beta strand repeat-containing protein [Candidatus Eisenbacteria bacterium]|nr:DUF4097 family beta strand repeat-containing protein [Candidatus Eisenbacteria bacterium]
MMFRSAFRSIGLTLLAASVLGAPACFGVTREFSQTYHLKPDGTLELNNINGTVRIEGWDKDEVEVHAVKTTPDKESKLDLVSIDVDSTPDNLSISTRYPQAEGVEVAVEYTVHVPRRTLLKHINTVNGTLRVKDLDSVGDLHTVNGNIEVYESSGNLHARTTNGNVYVELVHPSSARNAQAETTNGSVLLAIPPDSQADLEARCMNGSFSTELPFVMEGANQPRVLHGRLGKGGSSIRLGTVNGAIRVIALRSTI